MVKNITHFLFSGGFSELNINISSYHNCNLFDFNIAMSESAHVKDLCTCGNRDLPWCFIHEKVIDKQACVVNKVNEFEFICDFNAPV